MSWFTLSTLSADGNTLNQESTTDAVTPNVLTWCGIENSIWDGYESTNNERRAIYSYDSSTASNKIEWGNKSKYWIRATIHRERHSVSTIDGQRTTQQDGHSMIISTTSR